VKMVRDAGGETTFVKADVSREADVAAMVAHAVQTYGRLDCAFNNAGIAGATAPIDEFKKEDWDKAISVNQTGVFLCCKHEIKQLRKQGGGGAIVNSSSIAGLVGYPRSIVYHAAKFAVRGITKSAALTYAAENIRVNAICPGRIMTPMVADYIGDDPEKMKASVAEIPLGRLGTPEEVGQAVAWLCSEKAAYFTGADIVMDSGYVVG
jgi:NAD(P)-dependent dehydrogenase (short-subunit alcohol dehydrogenase family)